MEHIIHMEEDIQPKAQDDELNKAEDTIEGEAPRVKIEVPKPQQKKRNYS